MHTVTRFIRDESGASAIEHSLMAVLVALLFIAAAVMFGGPISGLFAPKPPV
jgi:Flp pilus assembly pilin Flp